MSYVKPKYILIQVYDDGAKVTHEFHTEYLPDVLRHFGYFLRGCSFVIDKYAEVQLVDETVPFNKVVKSLKKEGKKV